jgi:hypothetical protein
MIIIDLNQVILAGIMPHLMDKKNGVPDEYLFRHLVLNVLRGHIKMFKKKYGPEIVIACDNRKYWRKDFFPYYKASRKKTREKSDLDWHFIFDMLTKFKHEIRDNMPYKLVDVEQAEADDIIGTLTPRQSAHDKVLIISSDGDFLQLQYYKDVEQYNPAEKKFVKCKNPIEDLKEKIIRGDRGDGIPNIFSPGDTFVVGKRQSVITQDRFTKYHGTPVEEWDENARVNYSRNKTLIDLSCIPVDIKEKIINNYEECKTNNKQQMLNYFITNKLKNLIEVIEDF